MGMYIFTQYLRAESTSQYFHTIYASKTRTSGQCIALPQCTLVNNIWYILCTSRVLAMTICSLALVRCESRLDHRTCVNGQMWRWVAFSTRVECLTVMFIIIVGWHRRVWHNAKWHSPRLNLMKKYPASNCCECEAVKGCMTQWRIPLPCLRRMVNAMFVMTFVANCAKHRKSHTNSSTSVICPHQWFKSLDLHRIKRSKCPYSHVPPLINRTPNHIEVIYGPRSITISGRHVTNSFSTTWSSPTLSLVSISTSSYSPNNCHVRTIYSKMLHTSFLNYVQLSTHCICVFYAFEQIWFSLPHKFSFPYESKRHLALSWNFDLTSHPISNVMSKNTINNYTI